MKTIFFSLLITCFLFACSDNAGLIPSLNEGEAIREGEVTEEGELIPVSFNAGFTKDVTPFRASSDEGFTLNPNLKYLEHVIYKKNTDLGGYFFYKNYTFTDSDGSISCELPEGEYTSLFISYSSGFFSFVGFGNRVYFRCSVMSEEQPGFVEEDQFYNETTYTVEKDAENSYPIILERIVGKVEIVFEDIIPKDVVRIRMLSHTARTTDGGVYGNRELIISESDKIAPGYTISFFSYEGDPEAYILLYTYGDNDSEDENAGDGNYGLVKISNVNVQKGKILRYKGKVFEGSQGFSLEIIEDWDGTDEYTY
jgi:hypothetical protein